MGKTAIAKMIYFWVFILGGTFIAYLLGIARSSSDMIIMLLALSAFYWAVTLARVMGEKRRGVKNENRGSVQTSRHNNRHGKKRK